MGQFFFLIFRNCPKKGANWDAVNIVNALKVFLKRMKQKRPQEKKLKIKKKKLKKIKNKKKLDNIFFFFSKLPPKRCPGGRRLHPQRPQSVFEEDEAEEAAESSSSSCWPGYTYLVNLIDCVRMSFHVSRFLNNGIPCGPKNLWLSLQPKLPHKLDFLSYSFLYLNLRTLVNQYCLTDKG